MTVILKNNRSDVLAEGVNLGTGTTTGTQLATAASQKLAFWGKTPIVQPSGAAQAAVVTTASTSTTPFGYSQAQADAIVALVNAMRLALVNAGLLKGSA
jgi:hypothetical protein